MAKDASQGDQRPRWIVVMREVGILLYRSAPFVAAATGVAYLLIKP
jgi:hypothetical protein